MCEGEHRLAHCTNYTKGAAEANRSRIIVQTSASAKDKRLVVIITYPLVPLFLFSSWVFYRKNGAYDVSFFLNSSSMSPFKSKGEVFGEYRLYGTPWWSTRNLAVKE